MKFLSVHQTRPLPRVDTARLSPLVFPLAPSWRAREAFAAQPLAPRFRPQANPAPGVWMGGTSAQPRILGSLAAFGDAELVTAVTLNALQFLSPALLALHTSIGSAAAAHRAPNGTLVWLPALRPHAARLLANRVHVRVHSHGTGDVLPIHLLNMRLLLDSDPFAQPDDRVVILPANAVLFRPCAPFVRASPMSFLPGQTFSDYPLAHGWPDASSITWVEEVRRALAGNDTALRQNKYEKNLFTTKAWSLRDRIDGSRPTPLAPSPLAWQSHEGSWYPLAFLRAALSLLNGTAHDPRLWAEGRGRCAVHPFAHPDKCATEETILPSLAWQHRSDLVRASAGTPPLVLRVWCHVCSPKGHAGNSGNDSDAPKHAAAQPYHWAAAVGYQPMPTVMEYAAGIEREVARHDGRTPRYCGYKFVRDDRHHGRLRCALERATSPRGNPSPQCRGVTRAALW